MTKIAFSRIQFLWLCVAASAFAVFSVDVAAQEFNSSVSVNTELLPMESRIDVGSMKQDVEFYVNNQRYSSSAWEGPKIPVDISITLTAKNGNRYSAILTVTSFRVIDRKSGARSVLYRALDKEWDFEYQLNANFTYQQFRFDPFSSMLDFHLLMAIGFDMDTYGELDGKPYFEAAKQICMLGANVNAPGYARIPEPGVYSKIALAAEATDTRYEDFRKLNFAYHVDGLEMMKKNKQEALQNLAWAISAMAEFKQKKVSTRSILMQSFFDSKFQEIADLFKGSDNEQIWKDLKFVDAGNTTIYDAAKNSR